VLAWVGLGGALGALPLATLAGAAAVLLGPGLAAVGAARAVEFSVRRALHRPAMDLLYTPLPLGPRDRARWLGNVGGERLGEALGGGLVVLVLALAPPGTPRPLGILALGLGAVLAVLVWRLRGAYVAALEEGLTRRAVELEEVDLAERTTRTMVAERRPADLPSSWGESSVAIPQEEIRRALEEIARRHPALGDPPPAATGSRTLPARAQAVEPERSPEPRSVGAAPVPRVVSPPGPTATRPAEPAWRAALLSGDAPRIRAALRDPDLPRAAATAIVPLLADEDLAGDAIQALRALAPRVTGLLVDVLLDGTEPLAVRRRLPRVLMAVATPRAVDGLLRGLEDVRSEIRSQCGRALARLHHDHPELAFDRDRVMGLVRAEAQRGKQVWASQQALERYEIEDSPLVDEVLRDRATRSLEHVFALLSLVLPLQPLRIAFSGLHTEDEALRRTALEYLESVLPAEVRTSLWPLVAERGAPPRPAQTQDALADLMRANQSIQISLEDLRRQLHREP
jgi:hypothetical protein